MKNILRVQSSGRHKDSVSRKLGDELIARLTKKHNGSKVVVRDLAEGIELVDQTWIEANNTEDDKRSTKQKSALKLSDKLVAELMKADIVVVEAPVYNFGMPASLKAWFDQVCRARVTFRFTEKGPEGLLGGKPVYTIVTSGGTPVGAPIDYLTNHLKFLYGFIGLGAQELIVAERLMFEMDANIASAQKAIAAV
jgi:FMN-dependent NADH-azoreductase